MTNGEYLLELNRQNLEEYIKKQQLNIVPTKSASDIHLKLLVLQELEKRNANHIENQEYDLLEELRLLDYTLNLTDRKMFSKIIEFFNEKFIQIPDTALGTKYLDSLLAIGVNIDRSNSKSLLGTTVIILDKCLYKAQAAEDADIDKVFNDKCRQILVNLWFIGFKTGDLIYDMETGLTGEYIYSEVDSIIVRSILDLNKKIIHPNQIEPFSTHCRYLTSKEKILRLEILSSYIQEIF